MSFEYRSNISSNNGSTDKYDRYAEQYDPEYAAVGRDRTHKGPRKPKKSQAAIVSALADEAEGLEAGFEITYTPARFEREWLYASLRPFYDQSLITDVLASVKGGKEASVYRCRANASTGVDLLAAKVYRPRKLRNLRNDKLYREGRTILGVDGKPADPRDMRMQRAIAQGTAYGAQVGHTSWLMYEYKSLERLHRAGAAVPAPVGVAENAILMGYVGDERRAAPTLHEATLASGEAPHLFDEVLRNVELMLAQGFIHGDLSAYNVLYWQGKITLIDFPQVVNSRGNRHAYALLKRDVQRVCEYFTGQGVRCHAPSIADRLWQRYAALDPLDAAADLSVQVAAFAEAQGEE